jgi:hypothetical protein
MERLRTVLLKARSNKALQWTWARFHALRTSVASMMGFGCLSVAGVGPPMQLNLDR